MPHPPSRDRPVGATRALFSALVDVTSLTIKPRSPPTRHSQSRKNVEGTLFVVKRRVEPRFQFVVLNRLSTENCREDLIGAFEFELSPPYLLYRNSEEVNGIWFYKQEECDEMSALFDKITGAFGADAPQTGMSTEAMLASMGLGRGTTEPEPEPVPALQQTDSVAAFFAAAAGGDMGGSSGAPPGFAAPQPAAVPPAAAPEPAPKKERQKKEKQVQQDTGGGVGGGGGGDKLTRESVRAAMYKLVSNDNFIDLMVKELKRSM